MIEEINVVEMMRRTGQSSKRKRNLLQLFLFHRLQWWSRDDFFFLRERLLGGRAAERAVLDKGWRDQPLPFHRLLRHDLPIRHVLE